MSDDNNDSLVPYVTEEDGIDCANRPDLRIICHDTFCPQDAAQVMTIQIGDHHFAIPVCQFHLEEVERVIDFPTP
jgi:hypothetical protein